MATMTAAQPVFLTAAAKASPDPVNDIKEQPGANAKTQPSDGAPPTVANPASQRAPASARDSSGVVAPAQSPKLSGHPSAPDKLVTQRASRSLTGCVVPAHVAGRLLGLTAFEMGTYLPVDTILSEPDAPFEIKSEYLVRPKVHDSAFRSCAFRISAHPDKRDTDPDTETKLLNLIRELPRMSAPYEHVDIIDTFHFLSGDTRPKTSDPGILIACLQRQALRSGINAKVIDMLKGHLAEHTSTLTHGLDGINEIKCIKEMAFPRDQLISPATYLRIRWAEDIRPDTGSLASMYVMGRPLQRIGGENRYLPAIDRPAGGRDIGAFGKKLMTPGYTMSSAYLFTPVRSMTTNPCSEVPVTGLYEFVLPYELPLFVSTLRRMPSGGTVSIAATEHVADYLRASTALTLAAFVGYTPVTLQAMWNSIKREVDQFDPHMRSEHFVHNIRLSTDGLWILIDPSTLALAMYLCDFATPACALNFNFVDHIMVKHPAFEWIDAAAESMALAARKSRRKADPAMDHCFFRNDRPPFAQPPSDALRALYRLGNPETLQFLKK